MKLRKLLPLLLLVLVADVRADVFNMPAGQTSLQFVTVGDPGDAADPLNNLMYGAVNYTYQIGKYDVTAAQYVQFLNAVAATDSDGLYTGGMGTDLPTVHILQNGTSGSYSYSLCGNGNVPAFDITNLDAVRFVNWLQNGQPNGSEGPGTTETGTYTLNGSPFVARNPGTTYFLPSENEQYKAAYYKGGGKNAGYWRYPTQTNTMPLNTLPDSGNNANFYNLFTGQLTDPTNLLTPVGEFALSPSPYGTFDQGGDVYQWIGLGVLRGGSYHGTYQDLSSSMRNTSGHAPNVHSEQGFRIVSAPDPSTEMRGDFNRDGNTDASDIGTMEKALTNLNAFEVNNDLSTADLLAIGDLDGDGVVNNADLQALINLIQSGGGSNNSVPEPSTFVLAVLAGLMTGLIR